MPVGAVYFALYYTVFRFAIRFFDLKTLGREPEGEVIAETAPFDAARGTGFRRGARRRGQPESVDACTTRLRLVLIDGKNIDEPTLKALGARGLVRPSANALQVVLGPIADQVAAEMRAFVARGGDCGTRIDGRIAGVVVKASLTLQDGKAVLAALGGAENVRDVSVCASRLRVGVARSEAVDERPLKRAAHAASSSSEVPSMS